MKPKLSPSTSVPFGALYLDINNPRLGSSDKPGYAVAATLYDPQRQKAAQEHLEDRYKKLGELKEAIVNQGWTPIDSILVWEHPDQKGHYVVVEGNTRTTALRQIRADLLVLRAELTQLEKKSAPKDMIDASKRKIAAFEQVVFDTDQIEVRKVEVPDVAELDRVLPQVLGVRHIKHPQQWTPFAQNLYLFQQYEKKFRIKYGDKPLAFDNDLVAELAAIVSESEAETRKGIQSASAFLRFKLRFDDKLPNGEVLGDEDHYFFQQILDSKYPREQFKFGDNDLELKPPMEEVLFKWAFKEPRKGTENNNVFYKAENIRQWQAMSRYDSKPENRTGFATRLDVSNPDEAEKFYELEAEFLNHKAQKGPSKLIDKLIAELEGTPASTLINQSGHLRVQLEKLQSITTRFLKLIDAAQ
jgi:hypothetical protein